MRSSVQVEVWSDVACPWCYIGKRRFETAVASFDGRVEVTYRSFELSPDAPVGEAMSTLEFLQRHKGLAEAQVRQMMAQVTQVAADEGLDYRLDDVLVTSTRAAHEALHLAKAHGRQPELVERLFRAHFTEGRHIGLPEELADLAVEAGLERETVRAALESGAYAEAVAADIEQARAYGIGGVPFFVFDGRLAVSGAQPVEVFGEALDRARSAA